jgi:hypothetical protein
MTPLTRGHVVALRRNGVGIVWHASATEVWIVPIWGTNGPPRHRAEVVIDDIGEIVACGISYRYPVARCHMAFKVAIEALSKSVRHGTAPIALLERVIQAVKSEVRTRSMEDRLQFARTNDERCVQLLTA